MNLVSIISHIYLVSIISLSKLLRCKSNKLNVILVDSIHVHVNTIYD